jgi:hypothetical protein
MPVKITPQWPDKYPPEDLVYSVDFMNLLAGESISSSTWTCEVLVGTDAGAAAMISGAATVSGSTTSQRVINGIAGVLYLLTARVTTGTGRVYAQSHELRVSK